MSSAVMKGSSSEGGGGSVGGYVRRGGGSGLVVRSGYLKKLKTSRKKFFVLRAETSESSAKLEYYDSERKFTSGLPPKRSIPLKNCFNINKRLDIKQYKHVIALYTKDDCFCVVLDNEEEMDSWLKALLSLQHGDEAIDGEVPKPTFEHIWQVTVLSRGLGTTTGLTGSYRLCLTDKTLSLIKKDSEVAQIELNLPNIRSCGNLRDFFFLEIGRSSTLGPGELWMQTEDYNIAQNIHLTVFNAMSTNNKEKDELGPKSRNRSSSATESSKPNTMNRKQIHSGVSPKCLLSQDLSQSTTSCTTTTTPTPSSLSSSSNATSIHHNPIVSGVASFYQHLIQRGSKASERRHSISGSGDVRARSDSCPTRARTTSEGNHQIPHRGGSVICTICTFLNTHRPPSLHGRDISHSPPAGSPVSPPSAGCSTDSGSSYSLADEADVVCCPDGGNNILDTTTLGRYSHSLTPDEAIAEEDCPDSPTSNFYDSSTLTYVPMPLHSSDDGYVDMSPKGQHHNNSPTASLSSVTSGTPSTDMRFPEYQLEKVSSYFPPSEDSDDNNRPIRANSVGSRPEYSKRYLNHNCMLNHNESLRERAMSVGASKKMPNRVLPPHGSHHHGVGSGGATGAKSSSAPILYDTRGHLMVMDFSRSSNIHGSSGYMDMKPGATPPTSSTPRNAGYLEMKPGGGKKEQSAYVDMSSGLSPAKLSGFLSGSDLSSDKENQQQNDYMIMDRRKNNNNNNNNADYLNMSFNRSNNRTLSGSYQLSPVKSTIGSPPIDGGFYGSPKSVDTLTATSTTTPTTPDGYVEMSIGKGHQRQSSLDSAQIRMSTTDESSTSTTTSSGKKKKRRDKTNSSSSNLPIGIGGQVRSQPIQIQNISSRNNNGQKAAATSATSSSSSPIYGGIINTAAATVVTKKYSPPKPMMMMHLPLNNDCHAMMNNSSSSSNVSTTNSLPRQQRSRKNSSRRDSRDSSSSSITTPSSSSTIFPMSLNSPCSPPMCGNNMSTGITNPSLIVSSNNLKMEMTTAPPPVTIKVPPAVLNTVYKKPSKTNNTKTELNNRLEMFSDLSADYTPMDFDCGKSAKNQANTSTIGTILSGGSGQSDYVNFNPAKIENHSNNDYALMMMNFDRKLTLTDSSSFRPIGNESGATSLDEDNPYELLLRTKATSTPSRPSSVAESIGRSGGGSRPSSTSSELCSSSGSTIVGVGMLSRPDSVNSDRIRPSSTTSQQNEQQQQQQQHIHYASLDLEEVHSGSRSPRTILTSGSSTTSGSSEEAAGGVVNSEGVLQYAAIDFVKSEGLKHQQQQQSGGNSNSSKIKH